MGLISRVSSRTYRKKLKFFSRAQENLQHKNFPKMNMIATPAQQEAFKTSYKKIQELNVEREDHRAAKQKLNTQLSENNMVMAELKLLKDDAVIYKMVGPALIKQDPEEVKLNVRNRLNHIN